jgi:WD40 repeat protein/energy-coupling factor transporter ATP-binding protein EcfA2
MIREAPAAVRSNPFPGLRPFEAKEDYLFFGREEQVDEMLRRLRSTRFLTVLGASGSGKSSLVRSGLIPSLYGGAMTQAGESWRVATLRPGNDPLGNLAAALASPEALGEGRVSAELTQAFFETTLRASKLGLVECVLQARIPESDNVLVLVDQFEELFRFKQSGKEIRHEEAAAFARLLIEAARQRPVPIYLVLTMRSDFFDRCMELPDLPEAINDGLYLVPRMSRDELRAAITGPVAVGGAEISPPLVARLLNDVGDNPDQLPILQHALLRTWDRWEQEGASGEIDLDHYNAIGTMDEALSQHAEEALGELDDEGRRIAEILFKALTEEGADGRGVRRPVTLRDICDSTGADERAVTAVVDRFRQPGRSFLILRSDAYLDLSHESLMRIWDRLRAWVHEEAQSAQIYLGAARAAARHEEGTAALWRGPELQTALAWREAAKPTAAWARRYDPGFEQAMRFLDASEEERRKEIVEREEHRRSEQRQKLWRRVVWLLSAAALVTLGFGIYALSQKRLAETERQNALLEKNAAEEQRAEATKHKARAEWEAGRANDQAQQTREEKERADRARREAEGLQKRAEEQEKLAQQWARDANQRARDAQIARADALAKGQAADISAAEARQLSQFAFARAVALQSLRLPDTHKFLSALLALVAYRLHVKSGGNPEEADIFNALHTALDRLRRQPTWSDHKDAVRALAVDPEGTAFFSGSEDGNLRRFDLDSLESSGTVLATFRKGVRAIAVDPKGDFLAAGAADGSLRVIDLQTGIPRELTSQGAPVAALAFQPGGALLAAGRPDGDLSLWDLGKPGAPPLRLSGAQQVTSVAFNANGTILAAGVGQQGGTVLWAVGQKGALRWNMTDTSKPLAKECRGNVQSVAFSAQRELLACGTVEDGIIVKPVLSQMPESVLLGHGSTVSSLSFSPDGKVLVSGSSDHTVRLWDVLSYLANWRQGAEPIVLTGHSSWVWAVAVLPGGGQVISGGADRIVRLWETRSQNLADELCQQQVHRHLTDEEWAKYFPADIPDDDRAPCPEIDP